MTYVAETPATTRQRSAALHVTLWTVQVVVGVMFIANGAMKIGSPIDRLIPMFVWAADVPSALVRFVGFAEFAGGIGLIVPALTRTAPWLTPLAGLGLTVLAFCATLFHASRGEYVMMPVTLVTGALMGFVAWGRSRRGRILARSDMRAIGREER